MYGANTTSSPCPYTKRQLKNQLGTHTHTHSCHANYTNVFYCASKHLVLDTTSRKGEDSRDTQRRHASLVIKKHLCIIFGLLVCLMINEP